ncbi:MAG: restriction endonuclease subunit S [Planctomycetota bacterium]|nr:restriction endonuclease subunit S [Planctomycetota bacterium]
MIEGLEPYAEYKESGLSWLDRIPVGWDEQRSKYLFREVDRRSTSGEELRLSMSQRHGLIPSSNVEEKRLVSKTNIGAKICEPGDLVLNRLKAHLGVFALAPRKGIVSPDYTVLRAIGSVNGLYFCTVYRSPYCGQELRRTAKGIVEGFWRLYTDQFYDIRVPVPPPNEQEAIVRFLDHANRKIDGFIRAKRKLIGLLNEQKQAIIHRAVTRGLDPNVPLKPSGIPWLGDIPKHWETRRLKQIAKMESGENITSVQIDEIGAYPVFGGNGLRGYTSRFTHDGTYALIGRQGALCGNVNYASGKFWASEHAVIPTLVRGVSVQWFGDLIRTMKLRQYSQSAAQPGLSVEMIGNLGIPYPTMIEQSEIAFAIEHQTGCMSTAIARTEREIALMQEYRTRLTADIVTGKLDVRDAAAMLPDTRELGPTDEEVSMDDDDEQVNDSN